MMQRKRLHHLLVLVHLGLCLSRYFQALFLGLFHFRFGCYFYCYCCRYSLFQSCLLPLFHQIGRPLDVPAPGRRRRAPGHAPLKTEESTRSALAERVDSTGVSRIYTS